MVTLRQRVITLRWLLAFAWLVGVIVYELVFASWIHDNLTPGFHYLAEITFYGTIGPLLAFWFLRLFDDRLKAIDRVEKKAQTMEKRLASITHISADAILSLDQNGYIGSWNPGAEEVFGYTEVEVLDKPFATLIGGGKAAEMEVRWIFESVRREGYLRGHESVCYDARKGPIEVEITAIPLNDENREFLGLFLILRDISSRKQREEEIKLLNRSLNEEVAERTRELNEKIDQLARANVELQKLDQTRTEFVSLVSHQLRAPLTNMSGAVENIRTGCQMMGSNCLRMLDILAQQTSRLDRLVSGVLSTARIESGELTFHSEPVSIQPLITQIIEQFGAGQYERKILVNQKPGLPMAFADPDRVAEVLTNLLDNANRYSPMDRDILVDLRADQDEITVCVRDHGPGISPAEVDRVFEKFYRTDSSDSQTAYGYGLGLYVCNQLVKGMGGQIWAENNPDGGAVFSFTLPEWREHP